MLLTVPFSTQSGQHSIPVIAAYMHYSYAMQSNTCQRLQGCAEHTKLLLIPASGNPDIDTKGMCYTTALCEPAGCLLLFFMFGTVLMFDPNDLFRYPASPLSC